MRFLGIRDDRDVHSVWREQDIWFVRIQNSGVAMRVAWVVLESTGNTSIRVGEGIILP
jgi:hypothetical protein